MHFREKMLLSLYLMQEIRTSRYDVTCAKRDMTTKDILREKAGVCRQFVKIFSEMCNIAGIRVKNIKGYVRGFLQHPGKCIRMYTYIYIHHRDTIMTIDIHIDLFQLYDSR